MLHVTGLIVRQSSKRVFYFKYSELICWKKFSCCRQHLLFKRQKHLLNISNNFFFEPRLMQNKRPTYQKSNCVIELSPLSRQQISTSCICMKSESPEENSDLKNDPMVKEFLKELYDDFEKELVIKNETVNKMEINSDEFADKTDTHTDSDSNLHDTVGPENSELSEWLEYYELDSENISKDVSVTDLKHFGKKSSIYNESKKFRKDDSLTSLDNKGSGSDWFSNRDSAEEMVLSSSSDSDSRSDSDTDAEPTHSYKSTKNEFELHREDDSDLRITSITDMEDLSGQYIELKYTDEIDRYNDDSVDYVEDNGEIKKETALQAEQNEDIIYEEIDDFPDDFEDTEIDIAPWVPPVPLTRGKDGVFDLDDLVTLLRTENLEDICVMRIPEAYNFGDYMVIASAKSNRHLKAVMENVKKTHKMKKQRWDRHMTVEGLKTSKDWLASDLGNIILHIFLPTTRKLYDLETLWTLGEKFDEKFTNPDSDQMDAYSTNEEWFHNLTQNDIE